MGNRIFLSFIYLSIVFYLQGWNNLKARPGGGQTYKSSSSKSSSSNSYSRSDSYNNSNKNRNSNSNYNYSDYYQKQGEQTKKFKEILSPTNFSQRLNHYSLNVTLKEDTGLKVKETLEISQSIRALSTQTLRHFFPIKWELKPDSSFVAYLGIQSSEEILNREKVDREFTGLYYRPSFVYSYNTPHNTRKISFEYEAYKSGDENFQSKDELNEKENYPKRIDYRWSLLPINTMDYSEFSSSDFSIQLPSEDFSYSIIDNLFLVQHKKEGSLIRGYISPKTPGKLKNEKIPEIVLSVSEDALDESLIPLQVVASGDYISQRKMNIKYNKDTSAIIQDQFTFHILHPNFWGSFETNYFVDSLQFQKEDKTHSLYYYDFYLSDNFRITYAQKNTKVFWSYYPELKLTHAIDIHYKVFGSTKQEKGMKKILWEIPSPEDVHQEEIDILVEIPKEWTIEFADSRIVVINKTTKSSYIQNSKNRSIPFKISQNTLSAKIPRLKRHDSIVLDLKLGGSSKISSPSVFFIAFLNFKHLHNFYGFIVYPSLFIVFVFGLSWYMVKRAKSIIKINKLQKQQEKNQKQEIEIQKYFGDTEFSIDDFLNRVITTNTILTEDWLSGNMNRSRNLVSSGIYNRFRVQLNLLKNEGLINVMSDISVEASVDSFEFDEFINTIHVIISGSAKDKNLPTSMSLEERKNAISKCSIQTYQEYWSFIRSSKVKTKQGIQNGFCPNCGSRAENLSESNKCIYCSTIYNSSEYDWVLSEITQSDEWGRYKNKKDIDGLTEIERNLPFLSKQKIEDRASAIFWRWIEAISTGNKMALIRDATSKYLETLDVSQKIYLSEPVVGSVELVKVTNYEKYFDSRVEVLWSASGKKNEPSVNRKAIINLIISKTTKSPFGISEHSCPSCGGILPEDDSLKCAFCASTLPVKKTDWLLWKISN
ncbi:MAG: hypothetical protein L6Q54_15045 [Leptospiraceae bacterium]|nr:hypothetical protein [Leptospiraceae bacterium]MCK6382550.1 hypothetical protein [Leptospiraceae bacterium]NUM41593.1 hypothetical protein [Leptospiraceae bacterium]